MRKPVGPGPAACYNLPNQVGFVSPDLRKPTGPAFSFYKPLRNIKSCESPGPAAYNVAYQHRYGNTQAHKYSLLPPLYTKSKPEGPGPMAHCVRDKPFLKVPTLPSWSFGRVLTNPVKDDHLPPNAYNYSISAIRPTVPAFSLLGPIKRPRPKPDSPGPATYGPQNLDNIKTRTTRDYSFYPVVSYRPKEKIPPPNCYNLSYYRPGKSPLCYSFGQKHHKYVNPMIVHCDN